MINDKARNLELLTLIPDTKSLVQVGIAEQPSSICSTPERLGRVITRIAVASSCSFLLGVHRMLEKQDAAT